MYSGGSDGKTSGKTGSGRRTCVTTDDLLDDVILNDLKIRIYDNIAVATGSRGTRQCRYAKTVDTTKFQLRFTDVYRKSDGKIKAISTHSSPIDQK